MRIDEALALRLETAFGISASSFARVREQRGAVTHVEERGGAVFVDTGPGGGENSSCAFGMGLHGPVSVDDVIAVERFYGGRKPARVHASPLAHPSLFEALAARGFAFVRASSTLVRSLDDLPPDDGRARALGPDDVRVLLAVEEACYGPSKSAEDAALPLFLPPCTTFTVGEEAVGTLVRAGDVALLFAGMTRPDARGRGHQSALIRARLHAAKGMALAVSMAAPGSTSENNLRREGFTLAYTSMLFQRA